MKKINPRGKSCEWVDTLKANNFVLPANMTALPQRAGGCVNDFPQVIIAPGVNGKEAAWYVIPSSDTNPKF
jgi:hypothetical protein